MNDEIDSVTTTDEQLREQAVASIKRKRGFKQTVFAYLLINAVLVVIWAIGGTDTYFWPAWVIGGWGIGLAFQGYDAYGRKHAISEDEISGEMQRLRR